LDSVFMSPLMLPTLALGLGLLVWFNVFGTGVSMVTLVIGHTAITTPYILRTTCASLSQLDGVLLESAKSLGAGPLFAFRTVTLPLILPGVAAGAFIAFMMSFDNVAISLFLSDARSEVLPIRLWNIIESNLDVRAAAVSGVLIAVTTVLVIVMERVVGVSRHVR
ncbi:MAG: ABC transporter permease, partial [bacterium]